MIASAQRLEEFAARLRSSDWIAMDTEADSLHAYPQKLCLWQFSMPGSDELVDPLAGLDLKPLLKALEGRELILHGADYDLRMLWMTFRFKPERIFDTMTAARLLGYAQFGLTHLVERHLGLKLEKGPQTMNWALRPLPPRMELYARNDTHYLKAVADAIRQELIALDRLEWHRELCSRLIVECAVEPSAEPDSEWRLKGCDRMDRTALAVLRELFYWREREAIRANKPPYFVLSHETLVALAAAAVKKQNLEAMLPHRLSTHRRTGILAAIERALALPPGARPEIRKAVRYHASHAERTRLDNLKQRRDEHAQKLGIDPTLIAPRGMLQLLARDWEKHAPQLLSWQRRLLENSVASAERDGTEEKRKGHETQGRAVE